MDEQQIETVIHATIVREVGEDPEAVRAVREAVGDGFNTGVKEWLDKAAGDERANLPVLASVGAQKALERHSETVRAVKDLARHKEERRVDWVRSGGLASEFDGTWPALKQQYIQQRMDRQDERRRRMAARTW